MLFFPSWIYFLFNSSSFGKLSPLLFWFISSICLFKIFSNFLTYIWGCLCWLVYILCHLLHMNCLDIFPSDKDWGYNHFLLKTKLYDLRSNLKHNCIVLFFQKFLVNFLSHFCCCFGHFGSSWCHSLLLCQNPHLIWFIHQRLLYKNCHYMFLKT